MSLYNTPIILYGKDGSLKEYIVGKCDNCEMDINNINESFVTSQDNKVYHSKCYKGN